MGPRERGQFPVEDMGARPTLSLPAITAEMVFDSEQAAEQPLTANEAPSGTTLDELPVETDATQPDGDFTDDAESQLTKEVARLLQLGIGVLALSATLVTAHRGGNYAVVRRNLQDQGKANSKEPMPADQKRLRKRKRKKK